MKKGRVIKNVSFLLVWIGVFCFYACKELPSAEPFDPSNTRLHVVWSKPFYTDSSQATMLTPVVTDRYVAVIGDPYFSLTKSGNQIVVFDKSNGEWHPAWKGGINVGFDVVDDLYYYATDFLVGGNNKDVLFYFSRKSLHALSLSSGQSLWNFIHEGYFNYFYGFPTLLGSDILAIHYDFSNSYVNQYNSITGKETNLFSFNGIAFNMQWAINEDNDTLFFFTDVWRNANCYCLTKDSIVWKCNLNNEYGEGTSFHPIIVENKYVLFQQKAAISCVDFSTGKLIWEKNICCTDNSPILYYEGKVVVRPGWGNVSCYDVQNGNLLWKNIDLLVLEDNNLKMDAYKGNLYFTTRYGNIFNPSRLYCMSMTTGEVIWYDAGPNKGIFGSLTIDQETGYLYCHSRWSVMCVDLNKTQKK